MSPNVNGGMESDDFESTEKGRQEIYYDGYFYDITDFIRRHPGGNIIKFYTAPGEDATEAIQQFHFRSMGRVDAILKTFKKRRAEVHERGLEPKALTRHEAMSADFKKLFEDLVAEGHFEPSIRHNFIAKGLATVLCGFAYSRFGWLMHEGGHRSLTGLPKIDAMLQNFSLAFVLGGSSCWWNSQHNRHHAMPQRVNHDVDLATLPYVAFHTRTVKNRSEIINFFVRWQGIFYWTADLVVILIAWRFVLHPRCQLYKKEYSEMLLCLPSLLIIAPSVGLVWYIMMMYWFAFFLGINFALSHSHLDVTEAPTHWIEYSFTHTADITPSLPVDYFMGYLNYQIEHHLFPTMPQFKQRAIAPRVKALAEKHGLPYIVFSYWEACYLAMKNLDTVGRELTSKDHFKEETNPEKMQ